jgi:hypothetical protein
MLLVHACVPPHLLDRVSCIMARVSGASLPLGNLRSLPFSPVKKSGKLRLRSMLCLRGRRAGGDVDLMGEVGSCG